MMNTKDATTLGLKDFTKVLKRIRLESGHNQARMAEQLGITTSKLSAIECGKSGPDTDFIDCLIGAYGGFLGENGIPGPWPLFEYAATQAGYATIQTSFIEDSRAMRSVYEAWCLGRDIRDSGGVDARVEMVDSEVGDDEAAK